MKTNGHTRKSAKAPAFVLCAERALKLPLIVWQDGKLVEKPA